MKSNPYEIELADIAKEVNGDVVITYHTATIKFTWQQLQDMKERGLPTDVMSCIFAGLYYSGKSQEEMTKFVIEAGNASPSVTFQALDGKALNITSKEANPMFDKLVQAFENTEPQV